MLNQIAAFAQTRAKAAARRAAMSAAFLLVAGVFGLAAVAGLFAALFFWVEQELGPIAAGLVCAGAAIILAALALTPFMFKRRPPPPPTPTIADFVAVVAKTAPSVTPRQLMVTAALLGVALVITSRRPKN